MEHSEGHKGGGQQAHSTVIHPFAYQVGQVDDPGIYQGGENPPHQRDMIVIRHPSQALQGLSQRGPGGEIWGQGGRGRQQVGGQTEHVEGQRAVGEEVGIKGAGFGIPEVRVCLRGGGQQRRGEETGPLAERRQAQTGDHHRYLPFVGMEVVVIVPVQPIETQGCADDQEQDQQ